TVQTLGMKGIISRQKPSGPSAASMNGRRRPRGVWNESLHGAITGETTRAKTPSAPRITPISAVESVNLLRMNGRQVAVIVKERASPTAPSPRLQTVSVRQL